MFLLTRRPTKATNNEAIQAKWSIQRSSYFATSKVVRRARRGVLKSTSNLSYLAAPRTPVYVSDANWLPSFDNALASPASKEKWKILEKAFQVHVNRTKNPKKNWGEICGMRPNVAIALLWAISTTYWNFPHFSPCETGERKAREISICRIICSQGRRSYFDLVLVWTILKSLETLKIYFKWKIKMCF